MTILTNPKNDQKELTKMITCLSVEKVGGTSTAWIGLNMWSQVSHVLIIRDVTTHLGGGLRGERGRGDINCSSFSFGELNGRIVKNTF